MRIRRDFEVIKGFMMEGTFEYPHDRKSCPICEGAGWIRDVYEISLVGGESRTVEVYHFCLCKWNEEG